MAWTRKVFDKFKMPTMETPIASDLPQDGGITGSMPRVPPPNTTFNNPVAPVVPAPIEDLRVMPPAPTPEQAQSALAPMSLPAQPVPPNPMAVNQAPPVIEQNPSLQSRVEAINNKDYSIVKDAQGNVTHRGKDRDKNFSTMEKIGAAIDGFANGGIIGAVKAATDRNYFEKQKDREDLARYYPQIEQAQKTQDFEMGQKVKTAQIENLARDDTRNAEQFDTKERNKFLLESRRFDNRMKVLDKQREADGNKWDKYIDEEGRVWKQFKNDPTKPLEPVVNPNTGDQEVDPSNQFYETYSPITGQKVKIKGRELFSGEATIAAGDANRQVGVDKTNADALEDYEKQRTSLEAEMAQTNSRIQQADIQINGINAKIQELTAQKAALDPLDEAGVKAIDGQIKTLEGQKIGLDNTVSSARSEYDGAKRKYDGLKPPQTITAPKVGGRYKGLTFPSPSTLKQAFPNKSDEEIRRLVEAQGGAFAK